MHRKAISLFSGGLDSVLATKLILEQGIETVALHFTSPLCNSVRDDKAERAARAASELGVEIIIRDKGEDYLQVVKNPQHGYGKNMNPCIDCRIYMLHLTREIMEEENASFVVTGEVLGQRPMSQKKETIHLIEKESGLQDLILRPLSAKLFAPTIPEQEGFVIRDRLLGISGRSRNMQYDLAAKYGLKEFSCPGGGCLLTDPIYSRKLKNVLFHNPECSMKDVMLLRVGRHFRLDDKTMLVIGRNQEENEYLESLCGSFRKVIRPIGFKGPSGIIEGELDEKTVKAAACIIAFYSKRSVFPISVQVHNGRVTEYTVEREQFNPEEYRIKETL